jgi:hypothetical protein
MLTLNRSVVSTDTDYGTALLDERSGRYWTLNPTAALALRVLLDGGDPPAAARALLDQYDVAPATARADVDKLVDELCAAGLVTGSVSGSGIEPPPGLASPGGRTPSGATRPGGGAGATVVRSHRRSGSGARRSLRSALGRAMPPRADGR